MYVEKDIIQSGFQPWEFYWSSLKGLLRVLLISVCIRAYFQNWLAMTHREFFQIQAQVGKRGKEKEMMII